MEPVRTLATLLTLPLTGCVYESYERRASPDPVPPLSREESQRLVAAGISDPVLTETIDARGVTRLSSDDLVALKKSGAGDAVLEKLIAAERPDPRMVVLQGGYYYVDPHHFYFPGYSYSSWGYRSFGWRRWGW